MKIISISNLYPRPDQPTRGMFNFQLFREMEGVLRSQESGVRSQESGVRSQNETCGDANNYLNICLVPEWRVWRWRAIRKWEAPVGVATDDRLQTTDDRLQMTDDRLQMTDDRRQTTDYRLQTTDDRLQTTDDRLQTTDYRLQTIYLPVFYLPYIGRSLNWWFYYRAIMRRAWQSRPTEEGNLELGRARQPWRAEDVILASWLYPDAVAVARVAHDLGAPVWLRVHGTDRYHLKNRCRRRLILDAVRYAQGVICNCKAVADDLVKYGVPADKIQIVQNGVDASLFRYRGKEETVDHGHQTINHSATILFIGNLVPIKGPDIMLKAFSMIDHRPQTIDRCEAQVAADVPACIATRSVAGRPAAAGRRERECVRRDVERHLGEETSNGGKSNVYGLRSKVSLLVIGSGPMRGKLERMAKELGIADRVDFLGNRPHGEVALWMNVADVLCLTSRSEGMPNVVAEALASGLPVVATDVGACREMLEGEPSARVCRSEDVEGLAGAVAEVLAMEVDRKAMAEKYAGKYSWRKTAERIVGMMDIRPNKKHALRTSCV